VTLIGSAGPATAQTVSEFAIPTTAGTPLEITAGSDGAMWFTEQAGNKIGRITTGGVFTEYPVAGGPSGIVSGPDGNLWFTENTAGKIGKITTIGAVTEYALPSAGSQPYSITAGPDGNLWFAEAAANKIGRITTGGALTEFVLPTANSQPQAIRSAADGNLWFTEAGANKVGRITTGGAISEFANPDSAAQPSFLAQFPNGGLVFTEAQVDKIALIDTAGNIQGEAALPTPAGGAGYIAVGPDGGLWLTEHKANKIARLAVTNGNPTFREYAIPTANANLAAVAAGPDGNLWFTEQDANKIGRLTVPASTTPLVAAVLPASRSVRAGNLATAFATIINSGATALDDCGIVPLSPVGAVLNFQTTSAATNASVGSSNTRVTIPAGAAQSFTFSLGAAAPQVPANVVLGFDCDGVDPAQPLVGVNTFLFAASAAGTPDMIALAATPSGDGILNIQGTSGTAAFAVSTANVGTGGQVIAFVDTGSATVNATFTLCETRPDTGACIFSPTESYGPIVVGIGDTPTFSIFVTATGPIPFAPGTNRVFVRFKDSTTRATLGSTSVAIRTQ
jgi:streptogramin lyase